MSKVRFGLLVRLVGHMTLASAFALGAASACHSTDAGSGVTTPTGGSGGQGGGFVLNMGDQDAAAGGEAGAVSTGPAGCGALAGLGNCFSMTVQAQYEVANILLVIDKSGSM